MIEKKRSVEFIGLLLMMIFGVLIVFHLLVISGVIPYDIVWAGKIQSPTELLRMETVSLILLGLSTAMVALKIRLININIPQLVIDVGMWVLLALFVLNTIGNFLAESPVEKYGFSILTIIISYLLFKLAVRN